MKLTSIPSTLSASLWTTSNPIKLLAVLLILTWNLPAAETLIVGQPRNPDDEATLRSLENESGRAVASRDYAALERLWSEHFVVNAPSNRIIAGRDAIFAVFRHSKVDLYSAYEKTIESIAFDGDIAIVMGFETVTLVEGPAAGKPMQRRYTDVWRSLKGGWRLIARQATFPNSNAIMPEAPSSK